MPIDFRASQIQTNKVIASGSTGTGTGAQIVVYSHLADDGTAPNQGYIDQTVFNTGSIGTDIFLYVSGGIGQKNVSNAKSISVFGGDLHVSGNLTVDGTSPGGGGTNFFWSPSGSPPQIEASGSLTITGSGYFKGGLSGSLQQISPGVPYLLAGPNITIATNSLGQVSITGSASGGGGGSSFYRLEVLDYAAINDTNSTTVGQVIFPANQFTGSIVLHGVIANSLSTATGSVQLYNVTSGSYVEIGGPGITYLSVSGTNPTIITSVDLISASNFNSSSQAVYELQVSSSNAGSYGFFGGFELRPSGSFTGISYVTSSYFYTYTSGTWEDGGNKLATTSSVAIAGNHGTGFFADNIGADVFFYVSGSSGSKDGATPGVALFGGDVVISGVLYGGSPLKISGSVVQGYQTSSPGLDAFSIGILTVASGAWSHAEGFLSYASGTFSHAEGSETQAVGPGSHAEGRETIAYGTGSHSEGSNTIASGSNSHAEGRRTLASGNWSHAEGYFATGSGEYSHAEGGGTVAEGITSHAEGNYTYALGAGSHTEGLFTTASADHAHAEGNMTIASGEDSHSEGRNTIAIGRAAHAEGYFTTGSGDYSHAQGYNTHASGTYSMAAGLNTIASGSGQVVFGKYNKRGNDFSLFVIGDGTGPTDAKRSDILRINSGSVGEQGVVEITGSLSVSGSVGSAGTLNQYNGLRYYPTIVATLPYTASLRDYIIAVSASAGAGIELPSAEFGRTFIVKDVSGSAAIDIINITAAGGEQIDGSPNAQIGIDYGSLKFVYFGAGIGWGVV
jgi:hypothetical protein